MRGQTAGYGRFGLSTSSVHEKKVSFVKEELFLLTSSFSDNMRRHIPSSTGRGATTTATTRKQKLRDILQYVVIKFHLVSATAIEIQVESDTINARCFFDNTQVKKLCAAAGASCFLLRQFWPNLLSNEAVDSYF